MGTTSTIIFKSKHKDEIIPLVNIYQTYDSYIEGIGLDLAQWLCRKIMVNGLPLNNDPRLVNGVGDLAAQYIATNKTEPGYLYIEPIIGRWVTDYNYEVIVDGEINDTPTPVNDLTEITVRTGGDGEILFHGSPKELIQFEETDDEET